MSFVQWLEDWNASLNAFRLVRVGWEGTATWHAELVTTDLTPVPDLSITARQASDQPVLVTASLPFPPNLVALTSESEAHEYSIRDVVAAIDLARAGLVSCSVAIDGAPRVEISTILYGDGFSRHALNAAVQEIAKTYSLIEQRLDELVVAALVAAASSALPSREGSDARERVAAEVHCAACGAANPAGSRFCNQCGTGIGGASL